MEDFKKAKYMQVGMIFLYRDPNPEYGEYHVEVIGMDPPPMGQAYIRPLDDPDNEWEEAFGYSMEADYPDSKFESEENYTFVAFSKKELDSMLKK